MPFILGLNLVYTGYALLAGFGMAAVINEYPGLFFWFQIAGVVYIFWLGYQFLKRTGIKDKNTVPQLRFIDGVISQALNIKGMSIVLTMYSQFLDPHNSLVFEVLSLSGALLGMNLFTHTTWVCGGAWMAQKFGSNHSVRVQGKIFGAMLIFVALWLCYESVLQNR